MNEKKRMPGDGERLAHPVDTVGTNHASSGSILCPVGFVNPSVIPTAAGGVVNWATCDALHTLARELVKRGLVVDDDRLTAAIGASWAKMMNEASYVPPSELEALEGALEVGQ